MLGLYAPRSMFSGPDYLGFVEAREENLKNLRRFVTTQDDEEVSYQRPLHPATKTPAHQSPRLVGHSQITRQGSGRQLPAAASDEGNGLEPLLQRHVGVVEGSAGSHVKLPTASAAGVKISRFEFSRRGAESGDLH